MSILYRTALAILNISSSLLLQTSTKILFLRTLRDLPHQFTPEILHKVTSFLFFLFILFYFILFYFIICDIYLFLIYLFHLINNKNKK